MVQTTSRTVNECQLTMPSDGGLQDFISCWQWCNKLDGPNGDEHSYEI